MKQFDLQEYLKNPNRRIITRDGRNVRIICTNKLGEFPIVALIHDGESEIVDIFTKDGNPAGYTHCSNNLFFVPEKKIGWVSIYKDASGNTQLGKISTSKEVAELMTKTCNFPYYITTTKIEWEE